MAKMPRLLFILLAIFWGASWQTEEQRCATDGGLGGGSLRHAVSIFNDPTLAGRRSFKETPNSRLLHLQQLTATSAATA
jgi:hypothetical protein